MYLKINASGSKGNNAILRDSQGNQLIIDCGIPYDKIIKDLDFTKVDGCLVTHCHRDHSLSQEKLSIMGIDIYNHDNLQDGKIEIINNNWKIIPMSVKHNVDNFAFIIISIIDNKKILWCTDLMELPNVNTKNTTYDLMALEINYDKETVFEVSLEVELSGKGFKFHNSLENTLEFLNNCINKPKCVIAIHTSNSGLLNFELTKKSLKNICNNSYIAKKEMELEF